ncbi:ATP-dependent DNA ligase [Streptomyces yangpuensis]|uniref:ATP-dependent DNA ligase n=1 Tax=Streptomyces yangpuensis TaxID=1648182 RepID=A0ABY5Q5C0_9ACTN|nr:ATP-dependent DNA ligase [Streptomyces yangpuensis]UUY51469.1 ATP-dependent DNA ligase [Streptomyces yangpuensis]
MSLRPPVEPMLAQAVEAVPGPGVLGELAFEQKFDGYRVLLFTPARTGERLVLQTRRGRHVQDRFPDLVAAAEQLPDGLVLDGELLTWDTAAGRLSFEGLQRRTAARGATARRLAAALPACFVAFDVLQQDGTELLHHPYRQRRLRLEGLFATRRLAAPWTLCPMTTDLLKAEQWLESWTDIPGLEGIVVKAMNQPYRPGHRGWYKLRRRDTTEAIIGAITGTLIRPQLLLLGRRDLGGVLRPTGRTAPLRPEAARLVAENLTAAGPTHPWTDMRFASAWAGRETLDVTLVHPDLVAEISADTAIDRGGVHRHPVRFKRLRLDMSAEEVPLFTAADHGEDASPARAGKRRRPLDPGKGHRRGTS